MKAGGGSSSSWVRVATASTLGTKMLSISNDADAFCTGVVTVAVAIVAFWMLPDHPLTTRWLSEAERKLAHERMERDTVGLQESRGPISGFKQSMVDPRLWLFVLLQTLHLAACGFNSFFPTVVRTLGFSSTITLVLTCPPYLFAGFFAVFLGSLSGRFNERTWHITGGMLVAVAGFTIAASTLNTGARYLSCFLFATGELVSSHQSFHCSTTLILSSSRCVLGQFYHTRLGLCYLWPNTREEGCQSFHRQHHLDGFLHLHALSLPQVRRSTIPHGHVGQRCVRSGSNCLHLGHAHLAAEIERGAEAGWPGSQVVVRILRQYKMIG